MLGGDLKFFECEELIEKGVFGGEFFGRRNIARRKFSKFGWTRGVLVGV